jgi:hypothetical protein
VFSPSLMLLFVSWMFVNGAINAASCTAALLIFSSLFHSSSGNGGSPIIRRAYGLHVIADAISHSRRCWSLP